MRRCTLTKRRGKTNTKTRERRCQPSVANRYRRPEQPSTQNSKANICSKSQNTLSNFSPAPKLLYPPVSLTTTMERMRPTPAVATPTALFTFSVHLGNPAAVIASIRIPTHLQDVLHAQIDRFLGGSPHSRPPQ